MKIDLILCLMGIDLLLEAHFCGVILVVRA